MLGLTKTGRPKLVYFSIPTMLIFCCNVSQCLKMEGSKEIEIQSNFTWHGPRQHLSELRYTLHWLTVCGLNTLHVHAINFVVGIVHSL